MELVHLQCHYHCPMHQITMGPSLEDVILCLFEHGIPFKLLFNIAYPITPHPITVFESNWCPFSWQADKYEYIEYKLCRNHLLRLPHIRVAVAQAGGIPWHLCKQVLANDIPSQTSSIITTRAGKYIPIPKKNVTSCLNR